MEGRRLSCRQIARSEGGFTLVEVMVAATVLLVGVLGVVGVLVQANGVTWSNRAREQGVELQRAVVEAARSIPYDQLAQGTIVARIQAQDGLADSTPGSAGWTVRRRGITFTIAVGTCAVDDPSDGSGPHENAGYCRSATGQTTPTQCAAYLGSSGSIQGNGTAPSGSVAVGDCGIDLDLDGAVDGLADTASGACTSCSGPDTNPNDYKRVVIDVRWDRGLGKRYALQSTTVPNPGLSAAPAVTALTADKTNPILSADRTVSFTATLNSTPAAVGWYVDGTSFGDAAVKGPSTTWGFDWDLGALGTGTVPATGEVLDGTYVVSAKGFDSFGQAGTAKADTLVINRSVPYPTSNFDAGRNEGAAFLEWSRNAERDIEGYRVYRVAGGTDPLVCALTTTLRCRDASMPAGAQSYFVAAVDKTPSGNLREGQRSPAFTVPASDTPPSSPPTVVASKSGPNTILSWTAASDSDPGDSIRYYRIYRDGTGFVSDLYDRTALGTTLSYTDDATGGEVHTYRVVAVDQSYSESRPLGAGVTK